MAAIEAQRTAYTMGVDDETCDVRTHVFLSVQLRVAKFAYLAEARS